MNGAIPLGRYAGIPIRAHWSVLVILTLLTVLLAQNILPAAVSGAATATYWLTAFVAAVSLLACLLAHEIAHAALARRFGVRVKSITLWALGGVSSFADDPPTPRVSALVAAAGPVVSLVLGGVFLVAASLTGPAWLDGLPVVCFVWLAMANLVIGGFNLLPATPLDGGRLLHAWLWHRTGDKERATARATAVGQMFGYLLIGLGVAQLFAGGLLGGLWFAVLGWFIAGAALMERQQGEVFAKLAGIRVGDVMTPDPVVAPGWWTIDAFADHVTSAGVRHRVFPVVTFDGKPAGVVGLRDLTNARTATRLQDAARPLGQHSTVRTDEPLTAVLRRANRDALLVVEDGVLVGILTAADIARTIELAQLGHRPASVQP